MFIFIGSFTIVFILGIYLIYKRNCKTSKTCFKNQNDIKLSLYIITKNEEKHLNAVISVYEKAAADMKKAVLNFGTTGKMLRIHMLSLV